VDHRLGSRKSDREVKRDYYSAVVDFEKAARVVHNGDGEGKEEGGVGACIERVLREDRDGCLALRWRR
jgi:hypothetical protein